MAPLGAGAAPDGVIVGPDGAPWVTDGGLNAIARVNPTTAELTRFPLPASYPAANPNAGAFDAAGRLWFTGAAGLYGCLDPANGDVRIFKAPRGAGLSGLTATTDAVYVASLAGSYLGRVDPVDGSVTTLTPLTVGQGARRSRLARSRLDQ